MKAARTSLRLLAIGLLWLAAGFVSGAEADRPPAARSLQQLYEQFEEGWRDRGQGKSSDVVNRMMDQGEAAAPLIPQLVKFLRTMPDVDSLQDNELGFHQSAAMVLATIGPKAAIALAESIADGDVRLSPEALKERSRKKADPSLDSLVRPCFFDSMAMAFDHLAFEAAPAVPILTKLLRHPTAAQRSQAARCLHSIGPLAADAIPEVRALCRDADPDCRAAALRTLAFLVADSSLILPDLKTGLADPKPVVRKVALEIIPILGEEAQSLADPLLDLLEVTTREPAKSSQVQGQTFDRDIDGNEPWEIADALVATGLRTETQCTRLGQLLIRKRGKMDAELRKTFLRVLSAAGAPAHAAARQLFRTCPPGDQQEAIDTLVALWMKPPPLDLLPELFERFEALWRKTQFANDPKFAREYYALEGDPQRREKARKFDKSMDSLRQALPYVDSAAFPALIKLEQEGKIPASYATGMAAGALYRRTTVAPDAFVPWAIQRLATPTAADGPIVIMLAKLGPAAARAVPALKRIVSDFDYTRDGHDMGRNDLAMESWVALIRITGDWDHWLGDAEARFLQPVIKAKPDNNQLSLYFARINDLGLRSIPYLTTMASHADRKVASNALDSLTHLAQYQPGAAPLVLPVLLRRMADDPDLVNAHYFPEVVIRAEKEAAHAWPHIKTRLAAYAYQTNDPAEQEKLRAKPGSRYYEFGKAAPLVHLDAAQACAMAGVAEVTPMLLQIYEQEPPNNDNTWRPAILATLKALGVDLRPLAQRWVPELARRLGEPSYGTDAYFRELTIYGPHSQIVAPEILRYARLHGYNLRALLALKSPDPKVRAFLHVVRFRTDREKWKHATEPEEPPPWRH